MKRLIINICTSLVVLVVFALIMLSNNSMEILKFISDNTILIYFIVLIVVFTIYYSIKLSKRKKEHKYKTKVDTSNVSSEFSELYERLYTNCIGELEKLRKKVAIRETIQYILYFALIVGYFFGDTNQPIIDRDVDAVISLVGIGLGILGAILTYFNVKYKKKYAKEYKKKIISEFVKLVDNNLTYQEEIDSKLAESEYKLASFDNKDYNNFEVTDEIVGNVDGKYNIKVWDLGITKITGSGKSRDVERIFKGMFTVTECNNNLEGRVKICKNKQSNNENKIKIDSETFEKYFDVYSSDKILALRILTHDIMEMLVDFHNKYDLNFEIVLDNNKIYLRFATVDMFEPKVFGSSIKQELLYTEFVILKFILELTKKINEVQSNVQ